MEDILQNRGDFEEEIKPFSAWSEDFNNHYLLLDLPGFNKDEVMLDMDDRGDLIVSGGRHVHYGKYIYFHQTFKIPQNSDTDEISGHFDGDILRVTIPKKPYWETKPQDVPQKPETELKEISQKPEIRDNNSIDRDSDNVEDNKRISKIEEDSNINNGNVINNSSSTSNNNDDYDHQHPRDDIVRASDGGEEFGDEDDGIGEDKEEAQGEGEGRDDKTCKERVKNMLKDNGKIILIAALTVFIGVLAARRFDSFGK